MKKIMKCKKRVVVCGIGLVVLAGVVIGNMASYSKASDFIYTDERITASTSVEDANEILIDKGFTNQEIQNIKIFEEIEELKKEGLSNDEIIKELDEEAKELKNTRSMKRGPLDKLKKAMKMWDSLTDEEKELVVAYPAKALASVAIVNKATNYTNEKFGENGLGNKSDAFRHTLWCALMSKEVDKKWAINFSTAHEGKKTEEELEKVAADGHKEREHREMDLHNNSVGASVGAGLKGNDDQIINKVLEKLTNDKNTGSYWLHD